MSATLRAGKTIDITLFGQRIKVRPFGHVGTHSTGGGVAIKVGNLPSITLRHSKRLPKNAKKVTNLLTHAAELQKAA